MVYDVDQKVRTEQFRFFTEALKKDRLKKYVPMFAAEAEVSVRALFGGGGAAGSQKHRQTQQHTHTGQSGRPATKQQSRAAGLAHKLAQQLPAAQQHSTHCHADQTPLTRNNPVPAAR